MSCLFVPVDSGSGEGFEFEERFKINMHETAKIALAAVTDMIEN